MPEFLEGGILLGPGVGGEINMYSSTYMPLADIWPTRTHNWALLSMRIFVVCFVFNWTCFVFHWTCFVFNWTCCFVIFLAPLQCNVIISPRKRTNGSLFKRFSKTGSDIFGKPLLQGRTTPGDINGTYSQGIVAVRSVSYLAKIQYALYVYFTVLYMRCDMGGRGRWVGGGIGPGHYLGKLREQIVLFYTNCTVQIVLFCT